MNLIDENEEKEQAENKKKTLKIILISIAVLVVLAIVIIIFSVVKNNNTLKLQINQKNVELQSDLVLMADKKNILVENGQIYISVRKLVATLGGEYYNDEYKNKGEDPTKCHIKAANNSNEYTSYISNSSQIYKTIMLNVQDDEVAGENNTVNNTKNTTKKDDQETEKTVTYEYFNIENGVKYVNGEIYASSDAVELGFNVQIQYNEKNKTISIYTLDALEQIASNNVNLAVVGNDCEYYNKKLLKYGLVLIKNSDGDYGIANYYNYQDGNYIVSCKYSDIRFCESSETVVVTTSSDSKQGILKLDLVNKNKADTKIEPKYQMIKLISEEENLYLVKENYKFGIIKQTGDDISVVLKTEYQKIGIDEEPYDDMENKYIISKKYIPIKIGDKWGIATTDGKIAINPQYLGIGCNLGESGSGDPVIILPKLMGSSDSIVVLTSYDEESKRKLYSVIDVQSKTKVGNVDASEIYSKYDNGKRNYFMKFTDSETGKEITSLNIYYNYGHKENTNNNTNNNNNINNNTNNNNNTSNNTSNNTNSISTNETNNARQQYK